MIEPDGVVSLIGAVLFVAYVLASYLVGLH